MCGHWSASVPTQKSRASTAARRAAEVRLCDLCIVEPHRFTRGCLCKTCLGGAQIDERPKPLPITLVGQARCVPGILGLKLQYRQRIDRVLQTEPSPANVKRS